jgi:phosphopantetheine adenylyltransferase
MFHASFVVSYIAILLNSFYETTIKIACSSFKDLMLNLDERVNIVNFWKMVTINWYFLKFRGMIAKVMKYHGC